MGFDRFIFTGYARCPKCRTGLIIVDNKPIACPVCELKKMNHQQTFGTRLKTITQLI